MMSRFSALKAVADFAGLAATGRPSSRAEKYDIKIDLIVANCVPHHYRY
ncbi:hypothetical protein ABVK50_30275 (plasmid) [Mesorhizobium sp. WSM2240]|uniref:Uncharacterized protein n=2 Tax=unclassified Mesorhizobium TaxID=325217 RepID=A0AAU8DGY3_9HYPH